ncbi:MAG: hypothetical protein HY327_12770, partial [Chloroflexi bacterium]|nr:hypothetical protein [Chloroflexota bacterium]
MNFRSLLGISFVSVVGLLGCFVVVLTVMFALFIELFLPFGKQQAWDWMKGI